MSTDLDNNDMDRDKPTTTAEVDQEISMAEEPAGALLDDEDGALLDGGDNGDVESTATLDVGVEQPQELEPPEPIEGETPVVQGIERRRAWGRRKTDRVRRWVILGTSSVSIAVLILLLRTAVSSVLIPFVIAALLAYLLNPIANALHRLTRNRGVAVGIMVIILVVAAGLLGYTVVPAAYHQTKNFADNINVTWNEVQKSLTQSDLQFNYFPSTAQKSETGWREFLAAWKQYITHGEAPQAQAIADARSQVANTYIGSAFDASIQFIKNRPFNLFVNNMMKGVFVNGRTALAYFAALLSLGGVIIVAILYLVLLLSDFPEYTRVFRSFVPENYRNPLVHFFQEYHAVMNQYFVRQAVAAALTAAMFCLGFTAIELPMAVPYGIFVGLLSMIPYLQLAGIVPALSLAAFKAIQERVEFTPTLLGVLVVFVVIQLVQELVLKPFLVGRGRGMERLVILFMAFLWPAAVGVGFGILTAIPLACVFIAWYRSKAARLALAVEGTTSPDVV